MSRKSSQKKLKNFMLSMNVRYKNWIEFNVHIELSLN